MPEDRPPPDRTTGPAAAEETRRLRLHQRILRDFGRIALEELEIGPLLQRAVAQAAINCSLASYPASTDTPPCTLKADGFYFTASPNTVTDVTDFQDVKMRAIAQHASQVDEQTLALYGIYFGLRGRNLTGSDRIGEGLKLLRPLHLHCSPEAASI